MYRFELKRHQPCTACQADIFEVLKHDRDALKLMILKSPYAEKIIKFLRSYMNKTLDVSLLDGELRRALL
ncbi:ORF161 [Saltwater crocodilepox virus]|nr:virion redox protein [Saltwater crocodilepox virus]AVD69495.1 virion redox protein [Saltwater crocodilepox virus]QGT46598.1 ORF161 [Saltwater crocodilepox virus]QGT46815.1 ORF161 [Saltwater crocodilepox virus]QGT47030.1 ORF161 [Saltwater crocodilepox virus]